MSEAPAPETPAPETPAPAPVTALTPTPGEPAPGTPVPETPAPAKGYWPDDWITKVSKGDEKRANDLKKFQSPEALADSYIALQRRLSSGEFKSVLAKDAKPEEIAAWRKDNGIPEKPEDYKLDGITVPEHDKALVENFLKKAHASNMTPEQAKASVAAYYEQQSATIDAIRAKDSQDSGVAIDALKVEWGGNFMRNRNLVGQVLDKFPQSVKDALLQARMPDGTAVFNNVDIMRGFAALALEVNPAGVVVPNSGGDLGKSMLDRYNEIQKTMRTDRKAYDKDAGMQEESRRIIDALQKHGLMDAQGNLKQAA